MTKKQYILSIISGVKFADVDKLIGECMLNKKETIEKVYNYLSFHLDELDINECCIAYLLGRAKEIKSRKN